MKHQTKGSYHAKNRRGEDLRYTSFMYSFPTVDALLLKPSTNKVDHSLGNLRRAIVRIMNITLQMAHIDGCRELTSRGIPLANARDEHRVLEHTHTRFPNLTMFKG